MMQAIWYFYNILYFYNKDDIQFSFVSLIHIDTIQFVFAYLFWKVNLGSGKKAFNFDFQFTPNKSSISSRKHRLMVQKMSTFKHVKTTIYTYNIHKQKYMNITTVIIKDWLSKIVHHILNFNIRKFAIKYHTNFN